MKKLIYALVIIFLVIIVIGVSCAFYNIRDRHSGYNLDVELPQKDALPGQFQIGVAKCTITPVIEDTWVDADSNARYETKKGDYYIDKNGNGKFDAYWLAGFQQNRPATGIHDDIWARAVVFDDGNSCVALVVLDAIGIFHDDVITIREKIARKELAVDHVIICATHVHEVPDLMGLWGPAFYKSGVINEYLELVHKQTIEAVELALANRKPAYIKVARIDSTAHDIVSDTRPPYVLDDAIHLMQFCDAQSDSVFGIFLNWGNHPETLSDKNLEVTADFCHYWLDGIERGIFYDDQLKRKGIGGTAIFANGAIGGLMTTLRCTVYDPWLDRKFKRASFEKARAQGYRLADLVLQHIENGAWDIVQNPELRMRAKAIKLEVQNNMFKLGGALGIFNRGFVGWGAMRSEVNVLSLGDIWLLTIPGEINPEIVNGGIEAPEGADYPGNPIEVPPLRMMMRGKYNFVLGLANDEVGYIMPKTHWDTDSPFTYGAKKAFYGEINSLGPDTGPAIHREVKALMEGF
ncbi:hypothetical protein JXJ21_11285 [candidate division KSB1 bacterium]|nr:hypothetical protein [candidate division KSB1 bacterium]